MRFVYVGFIFISAAWPVASQPATPATGLQTRPFSLNSAGLRDLLGNFTACDHTTLDGAKQEVRTKTRNAFLQGGFAAVVALLSADSPEGRAASEFFPIIVSKLRVPAAIAVVDEAQINAYEGRGFKPTDKFDVCSTTIGPSQFTLVRPRAPSAIGLQTIPAQARPLPLVSYGSLRRSLLDDSANSITLASLVEPPCPTPDVFSDLRLKSVGIYPTVIRGQVTEIGLNSQVPVAARVDVIGPTPSSCVTSDNGQFSFYVGPGSYTVNVSRSRAYAQSIPFTLGDHESKYLDVSLIPVLTLSPLKR